MKAIRLSDDYRLNDTVEYFQMNSANFDDCAWIKDENFIVGNQALLVSRTNVSPNSIRSGKNIPVFHLRFDCVEEGLGGNSNPNIKLHSGWRGTTNDVSVSAHGVVKIVKIRELKNGAVSVTVK